MILFRDLDLFETFETYSRSRFRYFWNYFETFIRVCAGILRRYRSNFKSRRVSSTSIIESPIVVGNALGGVCFRNQNISSEVLFPRIINIKIKMNLVRRQCLRILQSNVRNQNISYSLGRASSFKSALSLENLYPGSKLKLHTPTFVSIY